MSQISEEVRARIRTQANNQCGYCRSLQKYVLGILEIEHIIPKAGGGTIEPLPTDSEKLSGYEGFYRVDSGEYRIIYRYFPEQNLVEVILVGKRNDDDVYKRLKRLLG